VSKIAEIRREKEAAFGDLRKLCQGLDEAAWNCPVHGHEDGWTVRDVVTHLATAGPGLLKAAQLMAEGRLEMRPDFDLDFWNQRQVQKQAGRSEIQLLDDLAALNRDVLAYLDALAEDDGEAVLARRDQHAVFGETTVEYVLRRVYQHEREHALEIRQALQD
jgi:hypothetical protein